MIDVDFAPNDRETVYNHMIEEFGQDYTAYILALGTVSDKGCIDEIGRYLHKRYPDESTYTIEGLKTVKQKYDSFKDGVSDELSTLNKQKKNREITDEEYREKWNKLFKPIVKKYPKIFYYFIGMLDTKISQSMHPCGMVVSPVTLADNYGTLKREGKTILQIDMDDVHDVNLVKYDILGLKNVEIIKDACIYAGLNYPKSYEVNWKDQDVWKDILKCPQGIFQFEGAYAFQMLSQFKPQSIEDMSLVTAAIRPSGASYRDALMTKQFHKNVSPVIDELLKDSYGFLVYQEQIIAFLQQICGLDGGTADDVRRAIAKKKLDKLELVMPKIQEGYINKSGKPREEAINELQEYMQILIDSSSYMFGMNHSIAYCMIGYLCAYLRYYHTPYFIVAYLNNAANDEDIVSGFEMAKLYGYHILPPRFRHSTDEYVYDKGTKNIYKGVASIKWLNKGAAQYLYSLKDNEYPTFVDLLKQINEDRKINSRQMEILIQLQYFEEFGHNKKLLTAYNIFNSYYGKKNFSKDKLGDMKLKPKDFVGLYEKETEKMYVNVDTNKLIERLVEKVPNDIIPLDEQINFELTVVGYLSTVYDINKSYCYVVSVDTKYSPKLELYSLGTGKTVVCKINKTLFKQFPVAKGDFIHCSKFAQRARLKKTETGWETTDEKDWWLTFYNVVPNISKVILNEEK